MQELTVQLAVEKVLYRLAFLEGGRVPVVRALLELPLAIEVIEEEADKAADGTAIVKDDWGEFLSYDFPELQAAATAGMPAPPQDCPTCGRPLELSAKCVAPVSGQPAPARGPVLCDGCYRAVRRLAQKQDESTVEKIKHFFTGEEEQDLFKIALVEHEIFFIALKLGLPYLTHTSITAQTRLPAAQVKERLDRLAGRRYVRIGLLPSGDALAYRFPPGLTYPDPLYRRLQGAVIANGPATNEEAPAPATGRLGSIAPRIKTALAPLVRARPADSKPVEDLGPVTDALPVRQPPAAPPPPPPAPKFNIRVKDKRDRGTPPRPPEGP